MKDRNIAVTLECFIRKINTYLILHRSPNKRIMPDVWMTQGGHREFNEGLFECTRREVLEETGLKIKNLLAELKLVLPIVLDPKREIISFKAAYSKGNTLEHFSIEKP